MVIYLCLKIYFPIDHHCKIQSVFSDLLEKGRIACSSPTVPQGVALGISGKRTLGFGQSSPPTQIGICKLRGRQQSFSVITRSWQSWPF